MRQALDITAFQNLRGIGGALCLDLSNTVDWRGNAAEIDRLACYADFVAWAQCFEIMRPGKITEFLHEARSRPEDAGHALLRIRAFREALYRIGSSLASAAPSAPDDAVDVVNDVLPQLLQYTRLRPGSPDTIAHEPSPHSLISPLAAVGWSLIDLVRGPDRARVRECANPACHWLYVDRSRNQSRRWCAMWNCGNRAKGRRFYHAHQKPGRKH